MQTKRVPGQSAAHSKTAGAAQSADPALVSKLVSDVRNTTTPEQRLNLLKSVLGTSLAAGGAFAALNSLKSQLGSSLSPPISSYTMPPPIHVYQKVKVKKKRKKAEPEAEEKKAADPVWMRPALLAAGLTSFPVGYSLSKAMIKQLKTVARTNELAHAKADFEKALLETADPEEAEAEAQKKKAAFDSHCNLTKAILNLHAVIEKNQDNPMLKTANWNDSWRSAQEAAIALALLTGIAGAYHGWKSGRKETDAQNLERAERQVNMMREARNPTFVTADVKALEKEEEDSRDFSFGGDSYRLPEYL